MRQSDNSEAVALLRTMHAAEIAALADLWVASWRETMPSIDFEARRTWIVGVLTRLVHATLVVECAGAPAGFIVVEDDTVHQLVVASTAKGAGLAVLLLDAAKARAGAGLTLEVNQTNDRAVHFYAREGFRRIGTGTAPMSGLATWTLRWP